MKRDHEIRIENLTEDETRDLLNKLAEHVSEAQVYVGGKPVMWGLLPASARTLRGR